MSERKIDLILVAYELLETRHVDAIRAAAPGVELAVVAPHEWPARRGELAPRVEVAIGCCRSRSCAGCPGCAGCSRPTRARTGCCVRPTSRRAS